ncbi:MAG: glutamine-hydrolyzing GMP synthase [Candidatus Marinimicrobia bacterium]|nr:glutamine-hydrolyzing GMP synthase [Candidatus Neomarinimicrobiota bacterium]
MNNELDKILILDFGSQYTQLIARRIREMNVYCEIHAYNFSIDEILRFSPKGIILSGSPFSVLSENAPIMDEKIFDMNIPILGICYGLQLIAKHFNGKVEKTTKKEYGKAKLILKQENELFKHVFEEHNFINVWMSHGDKVLALPANFEVIAKTSNSPIAVIKHQNKSIYALQFHPEVMHTEDNNKILNNFVMSICKVNANWTAKNFINKELSTIQKMVGGKQVICGLSGGVDSSVVALLLHRAIGNNLTCIFVNTGLLRLNEAEEVRKVFKENYKINLIYVNAKKRFLNALKGVVNPEVKRKIIGKLFIEIFEEEGKKIGDINFLAQGTLYPDVIESISFKGPSATIKSHHNVGGLPEKMNLKLIEPLRELFKDEVREVGKELGLIDKILYRHPFPGPGLAIRIIGKVTEKMCDMLRKADNIAMTEFRNNNLYDKIWQAFCVLLPVKTVGVMGDERSYENVIALRAVTSTDGMTADWSKIPYNILGIISNRIINEVEGINRVVYDISSKPPATIEWE